MNMKPKVLLKQFQAQLIHFVDELMEHFPDRLEFILVRVYLKDQLTREEIMDLFIANLLPLHEKVKQRDAEEIMVSLFSLGNKNKTKAFYELWQSDRLSEQDRIMIWKWIDLFFQMAATYQTHLQQEQQPLASPSSLPTPLSSSQEVPAAPSTEDVLAV